jgi:hypothetical protein
MADADEIRADIERTRADLAQTVGALSEKLDPKEQARRRTRAAKAVVATRYAEAKSSAPPPVEHALDAIERASAPALAKAWADKRRTAVVVGAVLALLIVRRLRARPA